MGTSEHLTSDVLLAFKHLSDWYPIGRLEGIGRKLGGSYNINQKIETSEGEFVVRILNDSNTVEQLNYIQQVLTTLNKQGVPVLIPLLTSSGEPFVTFKDKMLQVTPFKRAEPFQCLPKQVSASGRMLSLFHQALENTKPGPEPPWSFYQPSDYYLNALASLGSQPDIPRYQMFKAEQLAGKILEEWEYSYNGLPDAILHGDWHFWNQLYKKDKVSCIMDFDFIRQGKRVHDIAYTMWAIYMLLPEYSKVFDRLFLKEYLNLTDKEVRILPVAIARTALFFLCQTAYSTKPAEKWQRHYRKQLPLIEWLLAEGDRRIYELIHESKDEPRQEETVEIGTE